MYFNEDNNYFDLDFNNISFRDNKLFDIKEGFNKGNMFKDLYSKYKNYNYNLKVTNKKDELLYNLQMYNFALKDIILYLDIHPDDNNMLNEYQKHRKKLIELENEYEKNYGPLEACNVVSNNKWTWNNNPWPWCGGNE